MNTQSFKTENPIWTRLKRSMYALLILSIAIAIPMLCYLELSYNPESKGVVNNKKVQNIASTYKASSTVKI